MPAGAGYGAQVGAPRIRGETASVVIRRLCDNPPGYLHDVFERDDEVLLHHDERGWRVVEVRMISVT